MEANDSATLEQMREQLSLLQERLNKEKVINDQMIRQAMKSKVNSINSTAWISIVVAVFVVVGAFPLAHLYGLSHFFAVATILLMAVCIVFTLYCHRGVKPDMMNGNLAEAAKRMQTLKRNYRIWKPFDYLLAGLWGVFFGYELLTSSAIDRSLAIAALIGGVFGGLAGGLIGIRMQKKIDCNIDSILRQIEEIEQDGQ